MGGACVRDGWVTVVVGCLTLMLRLEFVVEDRFVAVDPECPLVVFSPPPPPLTANAIAAPAAATASTPITTSHTPERPRRRVPQFGHDLASLAMGAPQFGQKTAPGGVGGEGGWDMTR